MDVRTGKAQEESFIKKCHFKVNPDLREISVLTVFFCGVKEDGCYLTLTVSSLKKNTLSSVTFINDLEETMEYTQIAGDTLPSNSQYAGGCLFRGT